MHVCFYEEFKRNTKEEFTKLAKFLGVTATDEQLDKVHSTDCIVKTSWFDWLFIKF